MKQWIVWLAWIGAILQGGNLRAEPVLQLRASVAPVSAVAFRPDGHFLACGGFDRQFRFWKLPADGKRITTAAKGNKVVALAFAPDGQSWAAGDVVGQVVVHSSELLDGGHRATAGPTVMQHGGACVYAVSFTPDGRFLTACTEAGRVEVWEAQSGVRVQSYQADNAALYTLALAPDGRRAAVGGIKGVILIHDLASGEVLQTLTGHADAVYSVCFSPDGNRLASGSGDGTVRLWDVETGKETARWTGHLDAIYQVTFNASGERLISAGHGGLIVLWDATKGEALYSHRFPSRVLSAAFAPDGRQVAVGAEDGSCYLLELPRHLQE